jgi:hypothetical protein
VAISKKGKVDGPDQMFVTPTLFTVSTTETSGTQPGDFADFLNPGVSGSGEVAFLAALAGSRLTRSPEVLDVYAPGVGETQIADTGGAAPGAPSQTFTVFSDPVINGSNDIAFVADISGGKSGIWSNVTGSLSLVAETGSAAPGCNGALFSSFYEIAIPDQTGVVFLAKLAGQHGSVTSGNDFGIWTEDITGAVSLAVRTGSTVAIGAGQKTISALSFLPSLPAVAGQSRSFNSTGTLIYIAGFTDKSEAILTSSSSAPVAVTSGAAPDANGAAFSAFGSPAINNSGHAAFFARISGGGVTKEDNAGIWAQVGSSGLAAVALSGSAAPGANGAVFSALGDPVFNDNDSVAFVATLKLQAGLVNAGDEAGVWATTGGTLHEVARTGETAPGFGNAKFSKFEEIACPDSDRVCFLGTVSGAGFNAGNDQGVWQLDPDGNPQLIIRTGGAIMVNGVEKIVSLLDIFSFPAGTGGQTRNVNASNTIAFRAEFTDRSQGIFTTTPAF